MELRSPGPFPSVIRNLGLPFSVPHAVAPWGGAVDSEPVGQTRELTALKPWNVAQSLPVQSPVTAVPWETPSCGNPMQAH